MFDHSTARNLTVNCKVKVVYYLALLQTLYGAWTETDYVMFQNVFFGSLHQICRMHFCVLCSFGLVPVSPSSWQSEKEQGELKGLFDQVLDPWFVTINCFSSTTIVWFLSWCVFLLSPLPLSLLCKIHEVPA